MSGAIDESGTGWLLLFPLRRASPAYHLAHLKRLLKPGDRAVTVAAALDQDFCATTISTREKNATPLAAFNQP